jgi:hypothetical protein
MSSVEDTRLGSVGSGHQLSPLLGRPSEERVVQAAADPSAPSGGNHPKVDELEGIGQSRVGHAGTGCVGDSRVPGLELGVGEGRCSVAKGE